MVQSEEVGHLVFQHGSGSSSHYALSIVSLLAVNEDGATQPAREANSAR